MRASVAAVINALPRNETLKRGIYSLDIPERMRRYQHVLSLLPGNNIDALFQDGILGPDTGDKILECWQDLAPLMSETDELGGFQFVELRSTLPDELLMYADKLSMAHGLEVRVPYLDREVVEYVHRLPASHKVRNANRKWLHRRIAREFLPARILKRKKRGFAVNVVDGWFRSSVSGTLEELLLDPRSAMFDLLRPDPVRALFEAHRSRSQDNHKLLFSLALFEQWLRSLKV